MSEVEILDVIRSVFKVQMGDCLFRFKILQPSGGSSKSLVIPVQLASFQWTASSVAGKHAKVPIYILAQDKLKLKHPFEESSGSESETDVTKTQVSCKRKSKCSNKTGLKLFATCMSDSETDSDLPVTRLSSKGKDVEKKAKLGVKLDLDGVEIVNDPNIIIHVHLAITSNLLICSEYINILDSSDDDFAQSPSPPIPYSPLTPVDEGDEAQIPTLLHELLVANLPVNRSCNQRIAV